MLNQKLLQTNQKTLMFNNSLIKIALAPFAVLILHIIATVFGWYETYWWFDIPMHFMGGVAIGFSSYYLLKDFSDRDRLMVGWQPLQILILISITALAAVSWEFFEFSLDRYVDTTMQPSILDTMKDLGMGIAGGGLSSFIIYTVQKIKK
jgi:hypothetical protein